ncbi:hypothetical protein PENTCL1PPCAC_27889, partial [Pristionchus entomophagus]
VVKVIALLESLHTKIDALPKCECNTLRQELAEVKKLVSLPSTVSLAPPSADLTYSVVKRAVNDATTYAEKACRAVWVGLPECPSPIDTSAADQKSLEELCKELNDATLTKALADGHISHKRHPETRGDRKNRILKIKFDSAKTRDHFLTLVRSNHPSTITKTSGKFIRRDLCPFELELERQARIDAWKNNCKAGSLQFGIRDEKMIKFTGTPRPLPLGYHTRPPRGHLPEQNENNESPSLDASSLNESTVSSNTSLLPKSSNIFVTNARSIRRKSHLLNFVKSLSYSLILISETWLCKDDSDAYLLGSNDDFVAFRKDRPTNAKKSRGGGVAILCSPLLNPILVSSFTTESIESLIIDIHFSSPNSSLSFHSIRICLIYRAPLCSSTSLDTFLTFIEPLIGPAPFIMCGDLNFPAIDWHTLTSPTQNNFLSFVSDHRMTQYVDFKTRVENILDFVLSNSHIVSNVRPSLPFADHTSISFSLGIPSPPLREFIPSRLYYLADWNSINDAFVPKSTPSPFSHYPRNLKILYGKSKRATSIARNSVLALTLTKRFERALRAHQVKIESRIVESKNPKAFFSLCNTRLKACKSAPPGIIDVDGTQLLSCRDKASAFSKYFASVSTSPLQSPLPSHSPPLNTPLVDLPFISISQILIAISSLAPKCNLSPDSLPIRRSHNLCISLPFVPPKSHSSFVIRVIERWNVLDAEIVTSSPHIFRSHILSIPSISFSEESLLRF